MKKNITVKVDEMKWNRFKAIAYENGATVQELFDLMLDNFLKTFKEVENVKTEANEK
jgi:hypothetical protein